MGDWWYGVVRGEVIKIRQLGQALEFENASHDRTVEYFALGDDLREILGEINKDEYISGVIEEQRGLRILRQDPWECLLSFICATYKNIASIRRMLTELSRSYGERITFEKATFYSFPTAGRLARASLGGLARCGLGYRAKYVLETAKIVDGENFRLRNFQESSYSEAKQSLLMLPGVGQKVADCVLLFSLGRLEAFPVDVWVKRAILKHYAKSFSASSVRRLSFQRSISDVDYRTLNEFGRDYFGQYAGYAQEYLYHHERTERLA